METQEQNVGEPHRRSKLPIILALLLIIVGIGFGAWWFTRNAPSIPQGDTTEQPANQPEGTDYQKNVKFPPQPPEEDEVFSYSGRVAQVDTSTNLLVLLTDRGVKQVTLAAGFSTVVQKKPTLAERETMTGEEIARQLSQEYPATRAVQKGDIVTVVSDSNIKGMESFTISKIIIIE